MDRHVVSAGLGRKLSYRFNPCAEGLVKENGFCAREVFANIRGLLRPYATAIERRLGAISVLPDAPG